MTDKLVLENLLVNTSDSDLLNVCSSNKDFYEICNSLHFWRERYRNNGLILLDTFENPGEWVNDYLVCKNILNIVPSVLEILRLPGYPNQTALVTFINRLSDYNLPEVNMDELKSIYTKD